jgi:preprotein translocase subunit SecD
VLARFFILAWLLNAASGCAALRQADATARPKKIALQFCWSTSEEKEGYRAGQDEVGRPLYIAPEPFLATDDILTATVWRGSQRTMILLEFLPLAALTLERESAAHVGERLAVFVDERLVMSPVVRAPLQGGKVYLEGGFTPEQAEGIVRRLAARQATSQEANP